MLDLIIIWGSVVQGDSEDEEYDDDDDDEDGAAETALETYTTPLDSEDCPIDEYVIFKEVMQSKF